MTEGPNDNNPPSPTRKPRASFTVTLLDDPDIVALRGRGSAGDRAITAFFLLVLLAKKLKNGGRFAEPLAVVAPMIIAVPRDIEAACVLIADVCKLNRSRPFLVIEKSRPIIRSFAKWNEEHRGGPRPGAGRPRKPPKPKPINDVNRLESKQNQIDYELNSKPCASVSVSVSDSEKTDSQSDTRARESGSAASPPTPPPEPPPEPIPDRAVAIDTFERWLNARGRASLNWTPLFTWLERVETEGGLALARQCVEHAITKPDASPHTAVAAVRYVQAIYSAAASTTANPESSPMTPTETTPPPPQEAPSTPAALPGAGAATLEMVAAKQQEAAANRQAAEDRSRRPGSALSLPRRSPDSEARVAERTAETARREREAACNKFLQEAGVPRRHAGVVEFAGGPWLAKRDRLAGLLGKGFIAALVGPRGTGKTQMAVDLICRRCEAGRSSRYVKAMDVFLALREAFHPAATVSESGQVKKFIAPRLLVIDEYAVRGESAWEDRVLTHIIDRRYDDAADTLLISNQTAADFQASAGPSIVSRMAETGGVIECDWASYRTGATR